MGTKFEIAVDLLEKEDNTLDLLSFLLEDIINKKFNLFELAGGKIVMPSMVEERIHVYLFQAIQNLQREILVEAASIHQIQLIDACREAEEEANEVLRRVRCFEADKEAHEVLNKIRKSDKNI